MEGKVQMAWIALRRASSEGIWPSITPISERADPGEPELPNFERRSHHAAPAPVEHRGLGVASDRLRAAQRFEHALVEAQVPKASREAAAFDQERAVSSHAGDQGLLRVHDAVVPESRDQDAPLGRADYFLEALVATREHQAVRQRALGGRGWGGVSGALRPGLVS